ncbi:MAG: hypothetical protein ABIZ70_01295 [Gemmatimonadales bacterium]
MLDLTEFDAWWARWYPAAEPIAWSLREAYPDRWLRLHSLPESKRYPETSAEVSEVLFRYDALATRVLGRGAPCLMLGYDWGVNDLKAAGNEIAQLGEARDTRLTVLPADEYRESPLAVFGTEVVWHPGEFDTLLLAIADDRATSLWVAIESGAVFAPYDGGVDLIHPTTLERDFHRLHFASWRSTRDDGL